MILSFVFWLKYDSHSFAHSVFFFCSFLFCSAFGAKRRAFRQRAHCKKLNGQRKSIANKFMWLDARNHLRFFFPEEINKIRTMNTIDKILCKIHISIHKRMRMFIIRNKEICVAGLLRVSFMLAIQIDR